MIFVVLRVLVLAVVLGTPFGLQAQTSPPQLVWRHDIPMDAGTEYRGLLMAGGRAFVALSTETVSFFQAVDQAGPSTMRIPLAARLSASIYDLGNGEALILGEPSFRTLGTDGRIKRDLGIALPQPATAVQPASDGYLLRLGPREGQEQERLARLDGSGRVMWTSQWPLGQYLPLAMTEFKDGGSLLAYTDETRTSGRRPPIVVLQLDRTGRQVVRDAIHIRGSDGDPIPTGLHRLPGGGFLLVGVFMAGEGNFAVWLDGAGNFLRQAVLADLGTQVNTPAQALADEGLLGTDSKGALVRYDRTGRRLWIQKPAPVDADVVAVEDLRLLPGNQLLVAGFHHPHLDGRRVAIVMLYRW